MSYATSNGTATAGSDYTAKSGTLTFTRTAAGSQTFTVQTTEDTIDEGTGETFTVAISSPSGGGGASPSLGTSSISTTITDDDDAPTGITLSASPNSLGEDDSATSVTVTATLNGSKLPTDTVVTIGTFIGTATKGTDYTATTLGNITISANSSSGSQTFTVTPTDDAVVEGDETITIPGTTTVSGLSVSDAIVTLTDDDKSTTSDPNDKDSAELSISGPTSNVSEGGNAVFTVTLSQAVDAEVQVAWSAPLAADAAEATDLGTTSGTVTFAANSAVGATQTITIAATDDMLSETAESFTVTLGTITSTLSSQVSLKSGASSATATIAASDPITINISGPTSVDEGDATSIYTVSLSPSGVTPTADLTVSYATSNGTATAGSDYTAISSTLTFTKTAPGSQTFTVQTTQDDIDEGTGETFTVTISSPSGGGGAAPSIGTSPVSTTITDDDDAPTGITLSASPNTLGEDDAATSITVTATLNGSKLPTDTVVTIGTITGTATKGTDYTATTLANITISANSSTGSQTFTVTPTDDQVVEGDETITIPGTTTVSGLSVSDAIVTLTDDDKSTTSDPNDKDSAELSISGPASNVSEGSDATFTVTLSQAVDAEVQVAWSAPLGTDAAVGTDLGSTSGTVTFAANSAAGATQTITIAATDDALSETAESFTVTLGAITSTLSSQVSLKNGASFDTATIAASDPITINISGPTAVDEGDATTAYTVSLSPSGVTPTANLTVSYATSNGTATAGSDYTAKSGTLTFTQTAAGSQTFTVQTTEDDIDEGTGETFTVTITSPSGGGGPAPSLGTSKSVTTTITDDDDAPTGITLSTNPNTLGEDDVATSITVTATLNGSTLPSDTLVTIGTIDGTATSGTDYTATTLANITISANSSTGSETFTVTPTDDAVVEGDETIIIPGSTSTEVGLTVSSATVTLTDDNKATTPTDDKDSAELSITGPTSNVSEGSDAVFTVTLSNAVAKDVTVAWSAPLAADAAEGADLGTTSGTVTFAANSAAGATQSITIAAMDDDLSETAESFTVTLGTVGGDLSSQVSVKSGASSATATISESDPITVSISGPAEEVTEGDDATYTVSLSPSGVTPTADLTVRYETSDGTAEGGKDYTAKAATLTFTQTDAGDKTFTVQTHEDILAENSEDFTVTISDPTGGGGPTPTLGIASITTTIRDNDAEILSPNAPPELVKNINIQLEVTPDSVNENAGATTFTVTATHSAGNTRTEAMEIALSLGGTASDADYTAPAQASVTIPAGQPSGTGTLTLTLINDEISEGDETIIVGGSFGNLVIGSDLITIIDDDSAYLSITGPTADVQEGANASFTVTLSKTVTADVTVAWSAATGTATTADLGTTSGSVTFPANSAAGATQTVTVAVTDDKLSEGSETFTVSLGADSGNKADEVWVESTAASATATIAASDPITISISGPSSVDEGDATTAYTVSLSPDGVKPTADLTVNYETSDGTAVAGSDYTAKSGTLTFTNSAAGPQTFTVQTTEDNVDETGETFTVTISSPSGGGGPAQSLATSKSVTTTIADDDDAPTGITLSASPNSLGEDDAATSITVTATLNGSTLPSETVVTIGTLSGTATKDTDYTATTLASITIPANTASGTDTLTITPTDDTVVEGDETIIVPGTTTVSLTVTSATITLTDDDKATTTPDDKDSAELSISGPASNVAEGGNASFTFTLSKAVAKEVTVAWSAPLSTDTAKAVDLGATTSGTVTFAANSAAGATQTITVAVTDDSLSETSESFTVTLGAVGGDLSSQVSVDSSAGSATATIAASDPITVSISGPTSVDEGDATGNYSVSLSGGTPTADLTVTYATSAGTATAGTDYTSASGTLTFTAANAADKTFTVQTTEDTVDETGETFTVTISSPAGGGGPTPSLGTSASVTTTINDDDNAPSDISLSVNPSSVDEDGAEKTFTVTATLNGGTTRSTPTVVTINLGGTASSSDYTVTTALASVTIPDSSTSGSGTLVIKPTNDDVVEGDETIRLSGTTTVNLDVSSTEITITEDDSAELSIAGPSSNVAEGANAVFTVTLSKAIAKEVTVAWSTTAGTASSSDFTAGSGTLTFAADSAAGATQTITVAVADDDLSETSETFSVGLGIIGGDIAGDVSLKTGLSSGTATIAASDPITISISGPTSVDEGETATYTVSLSPSGVKPSADLTVSYGTSNGTATAGTDYTAASGTLTFTEASPGDKTFTVQTTDDTLGEGTGETFNVAVSSPAGGGGPAPSVGAAVTTTIADDDEGDPPGGPRPAPPLPPTGTPTPPPVTPTAITLSVSPNSIAEDAGPTSVTVTATLKGGATSSENITVTLALSGTAGDPDYTASNLASITISAGQSSGSGTLSITPVDDGIIESPETIIVTGSATGLNGDSDTITLTDATDSKGLVVKAYLSVGSPSTETQEGSNAGFTVTLSRQVDADVTVAWRVIPGTADAADVTATAGTVTFAANSAAGATQTIEVAVADDNLSELAETFTVTLGSVSGDLASRVLVDPDGSSASATIAESDPITVSISGPSTVDEGDAATYTVSLSPSGVTPTADLTVNYATSNGTAAAGSDYTSVSGTLTFTRADAGARTFTVQTTEDSVAEGAGETFSVTISNPVGGGGPSPVLGASSVSTTIAEGTPGDTSPPIIVPPPDAPTPIVMTLSVSPNSIAEDAGPTAVTVTVTLKDGATRSDDTIVTLILSGTAGKSDYTASSLASMTIPAGQSSKSGSLTITPTEDDVVEDPESIIITGTSTGLDNATDTITLKDASDDNGDVGKAYLSIESPPAETPEGANARFTVTLSRQVAADVTVAWSVIPGTAEAADVAATAGTVTFAANSAAGATQTIEVGVTDDNLSELAETFTVTLGTVSGDLASQVLVDPDKSSAEATISESDPITVSISGPAFVDEGDATAVYTVSLSPAGVTPTTDLTVLYSTADGTATEGSDYTSASGTLTFTRADAGPRTFTVQTTEDTEDEGAGESFSVTIAITRSDAMTRTPTSLTRQNAQDDSKGDANPTVGGPSPELGTSSATTTIVDDDAPGNTPSDAPPPDREPPGVVTPPTPTPTPATTPTTVPGTTPTPTPTPLTTATGGHGATPTPQPEKPASTTPDSTSGTTPTPTPTALPVPTPTPGTTSTLASGAASAPGATPTPSTLPPGGTSSTTSDTKRTLTLGKTTTITSTTSSTPASGTTTTITTLRASTTTPEEASTHGEETVVVRSQSVVESSGGTAPTPTPANAAAQPATANPLSWLSPTSWFLLLLAVLIALAIEAIRRRRRRARPLGV